MISRFVPQPFLGRCLRQIATEPFWLTSTPPLPDAALPAAQAKGRERYDGFVEALGRRLAKGKSLSDEVSREVSPGSSTPDS